MKEIPVTKAEKKLFDFIEKNIYWIIIAIVSVFAFVMRTKMFPYTNSDYTAYYEPWYWQIKEAGVKGFRGFTGGYNYAYDLILLFITWLPCSPLVAFKMTSVFFDYLCALFAGVIAAEAYGGESNRIRFFTIVYSCVLVSPVVMLNSAFWGQCESWYTAVILISVYLLLKKKYMFSFLVYGVALALKLQAIMIFPLYIYIFFLNRSFSVLNFFLIPVGTFVSSLPGMILTGNGIRGFFDKYLGQINQGEYLSENFPNVYYWLSMKHIDMYRPLGVLFTIMAFAVIFAYSVGKKNREVDANGIISLGMWSVLCCVYFLPNMHERYGYVAELLSIVWMVGHKKLVWYTILISTITLFSYFYFLFNYQLYWMQNMAVVLIIGFVFFTIYMCCNLWGNRTSNQKNE